MRSPTFAADGSVNLNEPRTNVALLRNLPVEIAKLAAPYCGGALTMAMGDALRIQSAQLPIRLHARTKSASVSGAWGSGRSPSTPPWPNAALTLKVAHWFRPAATEGQAIGGVGVVGVEAFVQPDDVWTVVTLHAAVAASAASTSVQTRAVQK